MGSTTSKQGLYKPAVGETGWGTLVNANFDTLDGTVYNVRGYGAVGNGSTNDTTSIQAAITACGSGGGGTVYFPPGTYLCNNLSLPTTGKITLAGDGHGSQVLQLTGAADNVNLFNCDSGSISVANNVPSITFQNLQLRGRSDVDSFTQYVHLIALSGVSDVTIRNCLLRGWRGDAVYFGSAIGSVGQVERHNERLHVTGCTFDGIANNNRNGISIIDGTDVVISDNSFLNCTSATSPGAIDIEPDTATYPRCRNITIANNTFRGVKGNVGIISCALPPQSGLTTKAQNFNIIGNAFENNPLTSGAVFFNNNAATTTATVPHNINVVGNVASDGKRPAFMAGVRGVRFANNNFDDYDEEISIGYAYNATDIIIQGNTFSRWGATGVGLFQIIRAQRVNFIDNYIITCSGSSEVFSFSIDSAGVSDTIHALRNSIRDGASITAFSSKNASHTLSVATNKTMDNDTTLTPSGSHWTVV